ncbi:MAG: DUF4349 domain-containing protein [Candidatus Geothermincolia bacterium]
MREMRLKGSKRWVAMVILLLLGTAAVLGCATEAGGGKQALPPEPASDTLWLERGDASSEAIVDTTPGSGVVPDVSGQKLTRDAQLEVTIDPGAYPGTRDGVAGLARSLGGYLVSENSYSRDGRVRGSITIKVPAERFEEALAELLAYGEVTANRTTTNDVTQEYVDLESRIRHLEAEEAFYLGLIGEADDVSEMLAISDRLSGVQQAKETAMGRRELLDNQVAYAAVTLALTESEGGAETGEKGFWSRVWSGFEAFGRGARSVALGLLYSLPFLALAVLLIAAVMMVLRRWRRRNANERP